MFEYISAFDFTNEIGQTKTKILKINFNTEFGRAILSTQFYEKFPSAATNYGITYVVHTRKGGTQIIPSCLVLLYRLKKSPYNKGRAKILLYSFLSRLAKTPMEECHFTKVAGFSLHGCFSLFLNCTNGMKRARHHK